MSLAESQPGQGSTAASTSQAGAAPLTGAPDQSHTLPSSPSTSATQTSGSAGGSFSNQVVVPSRGVTVLLYDNDPAFAAKTGVLIDRLASLNANSISLTIPLFQSGSIYATDIHMDSTRTPSLANLQTFIQAAHQRGMTVLLRPLLDDQNIGNGWRGVLAPSPRQAWYDNYLPILRQLATLGPSAGLDTLDVGSELLSLQTDTAEWTAIVADIRSHFSGAVTFSTNWDHAFPAFAPSLNFLSIDAFYPLYAPVNANVQQLVQAWQPWLTQAAQTRTAWGKPVVFTELGVTSQVGSFRQPWNWNNGQPVSMEAQRLYYQASCQAVRPYKIGMYWWAFYNLDPLSSPLTDASYDPEGKPAEGEIGRCYSAAG
jgi:hypothetical protein